MNQIIYYKNFSQDINLNSNKKISNNFKLFFIIFITSIFLILLILFYCISYFFNASNNYKLSKSMSDITRMKNIYNDYSVNQIYPIMGNIEIKKIDLNYPIFAYSSDEFLKLGICKIGGSSLNSFGNLCLAGHNYDNNLFFSNISKLNNGDIITIYDSYRISLDYAVYDIFEVYSFDTSVLNQNTQFKELTLITCNNKNKKRIIVKAKEIEK